MTHTITDTRPIAPPSYESWSALQRGQFLHMLRDCFNVLTALHTAPFFTLMLLDNIRAFMDTSIRSANSYRLPADFNPTNAAAAPFHAAIAHVLDVAAICTNRPDLDADIACGLIYVRTAHLIQALYPHAFEEWRQTVGKSS